MEEFLEVVNRFIFSDIVLGTLTFPFNLFKLILEFVLPIAFLSILFKFLKKLIKRILSKTEMEKASQKTFLRWTKIILRLIYIIVLGSLISRLLGAEIFKYFSLIYNFLAAPFIVSGSTKISFITIIMAIPVFYIASWSGKVSKNFINGTVLDRLGFDESRKFSVSNITRYSVMIIVIIIGLSVIGINLSALAVLFGVLGLGIGFGLQNTVANFFAGIIIIFTRPIKEGDRIVVNNLDGKVIQIRLLSTVINTLTEETFIIPNSSLVDNPVHNYSYTGRSIIITNKVQVSYNSDLDKVINLMTDIAKRNPFWVKNKEPSVRVKSFDDSGITIAVFTCIHDVTDKFEALSWTNLEIWRQFKEYSIEIPFPQMDLHIKDKD